MFMKNYNLIFVTILTLSTFIVISSNNWFLAWLALEINLMSMIPLMLIKLDTKLSESSIKYFITQALASLIMIISTLLYFLYSKTFPLKLFNSLLTISLITKAGMAPFHLWFPMIIYKMNWIQCALIMTWQKIAPFVLMTLVAKNLLIYSSILSALVGSLGGFNQNNVKILMTYSSISHGGWMINASLISLFFWSFYFIIYTIISLSLILILNQNNLIKIKNLFFNLNKNKFHFIVFNLMSLGGLPPFLGFLAKFFIILKISTSTLFIFMFLVLSSLISLFFYSRMIFNLITNENKTLFVTLKMNQNTYLFMFISVFLNILIPSIFLFN